MSQWYESRRKDRKTRRSGQRSQTVASGGKHRPCPSKNHPNRGEADATMILAKTIM